MERVGGGACSRGVGSAAAVVHNRRSPGRIGLRAASGETENEFIGLFRSDLEWRFSESGKLANVTTVTVGSERTVTHNVSSLTVTLIGDLAGRASFDVQHNSEPPPRAEATDTTTKLSLVYGF